MKEREALKLALEDLKWIKIGMGCKDIDATIQAIEEVLANHIPDAKNMVAQPEQEPVAKYTGETWCGSVVSLYEDIPLDTLLYTTPPQRKPLTDEQAYEIGAKGGEPSEAERLLFEAWMRGHCWAVIGDWDGKTYIHPQESTGFVNPSAMITRQLWAAWRDRAALEASHGIKGDA